MGRKSVWKKYTDFDKWRKKLNIKNYLARFFMLQSFTALSQVLVWYRPSGRWWRPSSHWWGWQESTRMSWSLSPSYRTSPTPGSWWMTTLPSCRFVGGRQSKSYKNMHCLFILLFNIFFFLHNLVYLFKTIFFGPLIYIPFNFFL